MGSLFGGGKSGGGEKAAAGILAQQRQKIEEALAAYNNRAAPFFDFERNRGEFGQSFFPDLAERIRNPTVSPTFKLYAQEGLDILRNNFARTGSPSSGRGQIAGGRYLEGLAANQFDRADNLLLNAVNQRGQLPATQEPQYLGLANNLTGNYAQAVQADKQTNSGGWGGLFGSIVPQVFGHFFP